MQYNRGTPSQFQTVKYAVRRSNFSKQMKHEDHIMRGELIGTSTVSSLLRWRAGLLLPVFLKIICCVSPASSWTPRFLPLIITFRADAPRDVRAECRACLLFSAPFTNYLSLREPLYSVISWIANNYRMIERLPFLCCAVSVLISMETRCQEVRSKNLSLFLIWEEIVFTSKITEMERGGLLGFIYLI